MIAEFLEKHPPTRQTRIERRLQYYALKNSIPLNVTLELGLRCNFRCGHCYNFDRRKNKNRLRKDPELSSQEVKAIIEALAKEGCLFLSLTGGEVLLHPHLLEFIAHAKKNHMEVRIKTNAALLDEKKAGDLVQAGLAAIDISLYGADSKTHERFTRTKNTFEKTVKGIEIAKKSGVQVLVNFILHNQNYRQYPKMLELAKKWNVAHDTSVDMSTRQDQSRGSLKYRIKRNQLLKLFKGPQGSNFIRPKPTENIHCACARSNCGINSVGDVYPCIGAPIKAGNIREQAFSTIWRESKELNWIRSLRSEDFKDCAPCPKRRYCPRSSGTTFMNTGNYTGRDRWSCETAEIIKNLDTGGSSAYKF